MRILIFSLSILLMSACNAKDIKDKVSNGCLAISANDFKDPDLDKGKLKNTEMSYVASDVKYKAVWCKEANKFSLRIQQLKGKVNCLELVSESLIACPFIEKSQISNNRVSLGSMTDKNKIITVSPKSSNLPIIATSCADESYFYVCKNGEWFHALLH